MRDECCVLCAVEVTKGSAMGRQRAMLGGTQEGRHTQNKEFVVVKMIPGQVMCSCDLLWGVGCSMLHVFFHFSLRRLVENVSGGAGLAPSLPSGTFSWLVFYSFALFSPFNQFCTIFHFFQEF